ncbi:MAG TPA: Sua5/YciO/YrdC/YwlC family protein, partial [Actinomycetota bacterium]|nr:Sua5/YciO/YrdC/YwlC family protein [Actinomycetota bacterium]
MRVVSMADADAVHTCVEVLDEGGIVVLPTDTVYGIAARIDRPSAVKRIFELKSRPDALALAVLVADLEEA